MPTFSRQRRARPNQPSTRLSRTLLLTARFISGAIFGFTVTVTFTLNPGTMPESEVSLTQG